MNDLISALGVELMGAILVAIAVNVVWDWRRHRALFGNRKTVARHAVSIIKQTLGADTPQRESLWLDELDLVLLTNAATLNERQVMTFNRVRTSLKIRRYLPEIKWSADIFLSNLDDFLKDLRLPVKQRDAVRSAVLTIINANPRLNPDPPAEL